MADDPGGVNRALEALGKKIREAVKSALGEAMDLVGITSQGSFWIKGRGSADFATHPSKLTVRTGRLIRSLTPQGGAFTLTGQREQIRTVQVSGETVVGVFGTRVPYAAIHEYGGTVQQPAYTHRNLFGRGIVAQMPARSVTVGARPFLEPALKQATPRIVGIFAKRIRSLEL